MKKLISMCLSTAAVALGAGFSVPAAAQWNTGTTCDATPIQGSYTVGGNSISCTASGVTAVYTAYSNIGASNTFARASIGDHNTVGVGIYSGSGETGTDAQHAMDNVTTGCGGGTGAAGAAGCGGSQEMMLVNFGSSKVNLTSLVMGFTQTDADVAILRWDGVNKTAAEMDAIIAGKTTASLIDASNGWSLVATESMGAPGSDTSTVNFGGKVSSWFIISTFFGTTAANTIGTLNTGDDRFKLLTLTGSVCTNTITGGNNGNGGTCTPGGGGSTPEPSSLALLGLAALGAGAMRRRMKRQA